MLRDPVGTVKGAISFAKALAGNPWQTGKLLLETLWNRISTRPLQALAETYTTVALAGLGQAALQEFPTAKQIFDMGEAAVRQVRDAFTTIVETFAGAVRTNSLASTFEQVLSHFIDFGPHTDDGCGIAAFGLWIEPDRFLTLDLSKACGKGGLGGYGHDYTFNIKPQGVSVLQNLATNLQANGKFFVDILDAGLHAKDPVSVAITPAIAVVYTAAVTAVALGAAVGYGGVAVMDDDPSTVVVSSGIGILSGARTVQDPELLRSLPHSWQQIPLLQARPAAPTNLRLIKFGPTRAWLRWDDRSLNESKFVVQRSTNGGRSWQTQENVPPNGEAAQIDGLNGLSEYLFRILAWNNSGFSRTSNVVRLPRRY
jgi:hypothetical protein